MTDWQALELRAADRYGDGEARLADREDDPRQRQLTRLGNAAWAAGLALLMQGRDDEAAAWLDRAVARYRESFPAAPPGSWGRPVAIVKARLVAGAPVEEDARWALSTGCAEAESPIGRYAACLALLCLGRDDDTAPRAATLCADDAFPRPVADALAALAAGDGSAYEDAVRRVLASFETRDEFLEDVPVADTVLVLQALAARRGLAVSLASPLLPG